MIGDSELMCLLKLIEAKNDRLMDENLIENHTKALNAEKPKYIQYSEISYK